MVQGRQNAGLFHADVWLEARAGERAAAQVDRGSRVRETRYHRKSSLTQVLVTVAIIPCINETMPTTKNVDSRTADPTLGWTNI